MIDIDTILAAIVVFSSQLAFIYFRTVNVGYVAAKNRVMVFWSGMGVNICWLISVALGVNALLGGEWVLVAANIAGGLLGADMAIRGLFNKKSKKQ